MPMPVISIAQMREWEKATWAAGQTEAVVIGLVGKTIAHRALKLTRPGDLILILAGKGHNGADARAARDYLPDRRVDLLDVQSPEADLSKLEALLSLRPALIIDGLFGIGINRPLDADWVRFIQCVNDTHAQVLAVDVPSGLNGDTGDPQGGAIQASITLTVGAPKQGLLKESAWRYVGRLEVATEIGLVACFFKSDTNWTLPGDFAGFPAPRPAATHKGSYGHLAIIAGSVGYHGAAVLAARGAQRARPGLITLFTQENAYHAIAPQLQAVMVSPWRPDIKLPGSFNAILFGPGLASPDVPDDVKLSLRRLWRDAPVPVIVDASALDWLPLGPTPKNAVRVITPHPGEAARLLNITSAKIQTRRPNAAPEISARFGNCWVVLKGHQTLIGRNTGEIFVNSSGNPYLAQGGSGDLLSGFLGGLLAQPPLQSDVAKTICYGVWQHGTAADRLSQEKRNWIVEDLAAVLGDV